MKNLLMGAIAVLFIAAPIMGFIFGNILGLLLFLGIAFIISIPLSALYTILDNQDRIMEMITACREEIDTLKHHTIPDKQCARCGKEVEAELTSCPFCGSRDFADAPEYAMPQGSTDSV